jgi:hypothetical protein
MYIGQSKKKCFKFSRPAPHRQDGSDTIVQKIPYCITGIEMGEHAHHMNPS